MGTTKSKILKGLKIFLGVLIITSIIAYLIVYINNYNKILLVIFGISSIVSFILFVILKNIPVKKKEKHKREKKEKHRDKNLLDTKQQPVIESNVENNVATDIIKKEKNKKQKLKKEKLTKEKNLTKEDKLMNKKLIFYRIVSAILFVSFLVVLGITIFKPNNSDYLSKMDFTFISGQIEHPDNVISEGKYIFKLGIYNENNYNIDIYANLFDVKTYAYVNDGSTLKDNGFTFYFSLKDGGEKTTIKSGKYTEIEIISQTLTNESTLEYEQPSLFIFYYNEKMFYIAGDNNGN